MKNENDDEHSTPALSLPKEHKNEIIAVRSGQHKKYFRMTMESLERVTFKKLEDSVPNQTVYELSGVTASDEILRIGNSLAINGEIKSISFVHKDEDKIIVKFSLKRNIDKVKVFHLSAEKAYRKDWCLIFITVNALF